MTIQMTCTNPDCNKALRARDDQAGKLTDCPFCGTRMRIPRLDGPFVAELEPDVEIEAQSHVEEDEVVDWIGPAIQPPPPRPKHKPAAATMPSLTGEEFYAESVVALGGVAEKSTQAEDDTPREPVGSNGSLVVGWVVFVVLGMLVASVLLVGSGGNPFSTAMGAVLSSRIP